MSGVLALVWRGRSRCDVEAGGGGGDERSLRSEGVVNIIRGRKKVLRVVTEFLCGVITSGTLV